MRLAIIFLLFVLCGSAFGYEYNLPYDMKLTASGYVGWRQIISDVEYDSLKSEPEVGLATSLAITDRLIMFNQFKYGTSVDEVLVYNQLSYTPDIPISDFTVTFKGGRILHDTFLYNSTRINPRTRQGVFQPQAMAWDIFGRAITSGSGVGVDMKYKRFSASYVIDKMTIIDGDSEAQGWANMPQAYDLKSKFGHNQIATLGYDLCEYGLRLKMWAEKEDFTMRIANEPTRISLGGSHLGAGIEWKYNDFVASFETMATKRKVASWSKWDTIYFATSATLEYDLTENWTIRANYNQYRTPKDIGPQVSRYSQDMNVGVNWHYKNYMIGAQLNYIQGGRLVDPHAVYKNPDDYDHFLVGGINAVYFFE